MGIRFSSLQEYHQNYIAPDQEPFTIQAKVKRFFENNGLSKILIPIGFTLAIIASIA
ncbi:MAG: hypothetical protein S4CHLAM2_18140 [Chlamydiales bacterium]|nr:hypothetical protein [Chlamydiales bacterium]